MNTHSSLFAIAKIWVPPLLIAIMTTFLFHRLSFCLHCIFRIDDPKVMNLCFAANGLLATQVGVLRVLLLASVATVFVNTITFFVQFDEEVGQVRSNRAVFIAN